jgi:hypothetical protein
MSKVEPGSVMDKRWPKHSIVNDAAKRKQIHRWSSKKLSKVRDGRIGLLCIMSWDDGYEAARRRFAQRRSEGRT